MRFIATITALLFLMPALTTAQPKPSQTISQKSHQARGTKKAIPKGSKNKKGGIILQNNATNSVKSSIILQKKSRKKGEAGIILQRKSPKTGKAGVIRQKNDPNKGK